MNTTNKSEKSDLEKKVDATLQKIGIFFLAKELSDTEAFVSSQKNYVMTVIIDKDKILKIANKTSLMNPNFLGVIPECEIVEVISHLITEKIKGFLV